MSNILSLNQLEKALTFWEESNIYGDLIFYESRTNLPTKLNDASKLIPKIGSEVSESGVLGRAIEGYQQLRVLLERRSFFSANNFLPRVPKNMRDKIESEKWLHVFPNTPILLFPKFLESWSVSKKVCTLSQDEMVKPVSLKEGNFLDKLPYDNFILLLNDPFIVNNVFSSNIECKVFFIHKNTENRIEVLGIPENIEAECMPEEVRKRIVERVRMFKKQKPKSLRKVKVNNEMLKTHKLEASAKFLLTQIDISTGMEYSIEGKEGEFVDKFTEFFDPTTNVDRNSNDFFAFFPLFLNGLCKLISEIPPAQVGQFVQFTNLEKSEIQNSTTEPKRPLNVEITDEVLEWFEVPVSHTKNIFVEKDENGKVILVVRTGGEKAPHLRRGHWRHYPKDDGSVRRVWISTVQVRKDRLVEHSATGSVSVFKE